MLNKFTPTDITTMMSLTAIQSLLLKLGNCSNWVTNLHSQIQGAYNKIDGSQLLGTTHTNAANSQEQDCSDSDDDGREWQPPKFPVTLPNISDFEAVSDTS